jgi:hypothetical protein
MVFRTRQTQGSYAHMAAFFSFLMIVSFFFDSPAEVFAGIKTIWFSPSNLLTDYMRIAGVGAALFNAGLIGLLSLQMLHSSNVRMDGNAFAGLITMCGFALFGKNLFNSIPITMGVMLYARLQVIPFQDVATVGLFATSLGPLVSSLAFGLGLPWHIGIPAGYLAGLIAGFVVVPLSKACINFHRGYNLYNTGFTAGLIAMFAAGILRMFGLRIETVQLLSSGNDFKLSVLLLSVFAALLLFGLRLNNWTFLGYRNLLNQSGRLRSDYIRKCGYGLTLINVAFMGLIAWAFVRALGSSLNGPTVGAIFTVMGFSAFGCHPKNTLPVILGSMLACALNIHEPYGTVSVLSILFSSTLAPVAGYFGTLPGFLAGFAHVSVSLNISYLHGGMNLYNNGFAGGFVAAVLVPLFLAFDIRKGKRFHFKISSIRGSQKE